MNLGDGGQVLTTQQMIEASRDPGLRTHPHGAYELKNIAEPVQIIEILWAEGQKPLEPGTS
jgi:class 3 adenylate cyclase